METLNQKIEKQFGEQISPHLFSPYIEQNDNGCYELKRVGENPNLSAKRLSDLVELISETTFYFEGKEFLFKL